jgi:hypothetical protein
MVSHELLTQKDLKPWILPISTYQVPRISGMSHWYQPFSVTFTHSEGLTVEILIPNSTPEAAITIMILF